MALETTLKWYGDKKKKDMNNAMIKTLNLGINVLDTAVKSVTPVKDGYLRGANEKSVNPTKLIAQESNDMEYAPAVEFGTKHQRAQPFMRRGLLESAPKIIRIAKQEGGKAVGS